MRDLILPVNALSQFVAYATLTLPSGLFSSVAQGTYTLVDNTGASIASGNVSGSTGSGAITLTEWVTLNAASLALSGGLYVLTLKLPATPNDSAGQRTPIYEIILSVPGSRPSRAIPPTADDLQVLLTSADMLDNPPTAKQKLLDLDGFVATGIANWEQLTGYFPYIAPVGDTVIYRTPEGPGDAPQSGIPGWWQFGIRTYGGNDLLPMRKGVLSVTELRTWVDTNNVGIVLTQGRDFFLYPTTAPEYKKPFTSIKFSAPQWGGVNSIKITGRFGFTVGLTENDWKAILYMGGVEAIPYVENIKTGATISTQQDDVKRVFRTANGLGPYSSISSQWSSFATKQGMTRIRKGLI